MALVRWESPQVVPEKRVRMSDYEVIDYDGNLQGGTEARKYPDGSLRNEKELMLTPLPGGHTITHEDARELSLTRWKRSREAAIKGMIAGVEASGIKLTNATGDEAWEQVISHTVKVYMKSENIRGLGEALSKIGIATGFLDPKAESLDAVGIVFSEGAASELLEMTQKSIEPGCHRRNR